MNRGLLWTGAWFDSLRTTGLLAGEEGRVPRPDNGGRCVTSETCALADAHRSLGERVHRLPPLRLGPAPTAREMEAYLLRAGWERVQPTPPTGPWWQPPRVAGAKRGARKRIRAAFVLAWDAAHFGRRP